MALPKPEEGREVQLESYSLRNMYLNIIVVNLLYFSIGMTVVWTSPMLPVLKTSLKLVTMQEAAITSSFFFGAMMGPSLGAALVSSLRLMLVLSCGHKSIMWLHIVLSLVSLTLIALLTSVFSICLGRMLSGVACAAVLRHVPVYVTEVTEPEVRAIQRALAIPFQTLGYLLVYALGHQLHYYQLCFLFVPVPVICLACQVWMPESPYFLISKGRFSQALQTVNFLRRGISSNAAELIVQQIQKDVNERQSDQSDWFTMLSDEDNIRALILALTFVSLEQLSGPTLVLVTLHTLLSESRVKTNFSATVIAVAVFLTAVTAPPIIRKYDHKKFLIGSSIVLAVFMLVLGGYFLSIEQGGHSPRLSLLPFLCLLLYLAFYQAGFGNCKEKVVAKLFSPDFKALGKTCTDSVSFFISFLIIYIYFPLEEFFNTTAVMWIFSMFSLTTGVFLVFCLPALSFVKPDTINK